MIWHLIDSSTVGGAERHLATLVSSLARRGYPAEVVLYQRHGENPWLRQLTAAGLPFRILDGSLSGLLKALRSERPELLHTHGYKSGVIGRIAAMLAGVPSVSTFHSGERGRMPVAAYELADEWSSFLGRRIAVSPAIARRLPFGSTVIPSYVVVPPTAPEGRLPPCVGFLGRLGPEKGPDLFCAIAEAVGDPGIEWHVYGDGPMRAALEARYGGLVRFHGVVADVAPIWPTLGLLAMPSRFEGVPLAALEAMAMGVPVLASRVGGLPDVVPDGLAGWLFPPGDIEAAVASIRQWRNLGPGEGEAMRRACREHVARHYSEETLLPKVLAVYREAGLNFSAVPA